MANNSPHFRHQGNPAFEFGAGCIRSIPAYLGDARSILIVTGRHFPETPAWKTLKKILETAGITFYRETVGSEPSPEVVDALTAKAREKNVHAVVAIGGGSVLDAGKAVAAMYCHTGSVANYLETVGTCKPQGKTLPLIALPTTAGTGSEATKNAVISRPGVKGFKKSLRHNAFVPAAALIDPELATGCPPEITRSCALDCLCQLLESFVSTGSTPFTDMLVREGLLWFHRGLPLLDSGINTNISSRSYGAATLNRSNSSGGIAKETELRGALALAAYFSGLSLANAGLGTVHGIAGPLGGRCHVPHGTACGLLAAPVFRRLAEEGPSDALSKLAEAGAILLRGGRDSHDSQEKPGVEEVSALVNFLHVTARPLKRLGSYGLNRETLDTLARNSDNKKFPLQFGEARRREILLEAL